MKRIYIDNNQGMKVMYRKYEKRQTLEANVLEPVFYLLFQYMRIVSFLMDTKENVYSSYLYLIYDRSIYKTILSFKLSGRSKLNMPVIGDENNIRG
jgi:hypothetical protein